MPGNPRHLYRSILREISYHFDDLTRALLPKYIRDSFDRSTEILSSLQEKNDEILHRDRLLSYHKLGRRTHSLLIRANAGEQKAAIRVLKYTYGRIGRRSRELMEVSSALSVQLRSSTIAKLFLTSDCQCSLCYRKNITLHLCQMNPTHPRQRFFLSWRRSRPHKLPS